MEKKFRSILCLLQIDNTIRLFNKLKIENFKLQLCIRPKKKNPFHFLKFRHFKYSIKQIVLPDICRGYL